MPSSNKAPDENPSSAPTHIGSGQAWTPKIKIEKSRDETSQKMHIMKIDGDGGVGLICFDYKTSEDTRQNMQIIQIITDDTDAAVLQQCVDVFWCN